ncbi:MAG: signal peptide peptidase SppA [Bdellovibrionaceae bacterium]|nr:signal peptide peptidase SppA [Pseudobdellovibrionaceae bacterium]|tara:strand:+ start:14646 stop:15572 length:927 start_codon:yes stop_codon:yes gene_type:complete
MLKTLTQLVKLLIFLVILIGVSMMVAGTFNAVGPSQKSFLTEPSILSMELDGVIIDGKEFIDNLAKYRKKDQIKGILITLNSPGGVVGPSQEIYAEIKRTREEFGKPVYVYCRSVAASGAYYAAVGSDRIFTTPGCLMGSIGVIMEFVNLEKLYDWAKVERFALTTGKFKDTGAEYRPMKPDEKVYLQSQLDEVLSQFKQAVREGRKMRDDVLDANADGRVMSGAKAVELGFADEVGTWEDARQALGEKVGLGKDPKIFEPKKPMSFMERLFEQDDSMPFESTFKEIFQTQLRGKPLFIFPGFLGYSK